MNHTRVSHRDLALDQVAAAQVYDDLRKGLEERRANEPDNAQQLGRMIGEANGALGVCLKLADVHATLAVAEAITGNGGRRAVVDQVEALQRYFAAYVPDGVSVVCQRGEHGACSRTVTYCRCECHEIADALAGADS